MSNEIDKTYGGLVTGEAAEMSYWEGLELLGQVPVGNLYERVKHHNYKTEYKKVNNNLSDPWIEYHVKEYL